MLVRKRKKYRQFIRYIRDGYFKTFYKSANDIGVNKETISRWFDTTNVQKALDEDTDRFISTIAIPRLSWRDHAKKIDILLVSCKNK